MKTSIQNWLGKAKRRMERRLGPKRWSDQPKPMFAACNIRYEAAERIEHLELHRNDEVYRNALGAQRIPDPTTAGDFCRRFQVADVERLLECSHEAHLRVWKRQPRAFFREAMIDGDGTNRVSHFSRFLPPTSWLERDTIGLLRPRLVGPHAVFPLPRPAPRATAKRDQHLNPLEDLGQSVSFSRSDADRAATFAEIGIEQVPFGFLVHHRFLS